MNPLTSPPLRCPPASYLHTSYRRSRPLQLPTAGPSLLTLARVVRRRFADGRRCIGVAFCLVFYHLGFSVNVMSVVLSIFCMIAGFIGLDVPVFIDK